MEACGLTAVTGESSAAKSRTLKGLCMQLLASYLKFIAQTLYRLLRLTYKHKYEVRPSLSMLLRKHDVVT